MKQQPIYNSNRGHLKRPGRRRIGQMGKDLRNELKSLTAHEIASMKIAAGMMLISIGN